jgi:hypothetical protein
MLHTHVVLNQIRLQKSTHDFTILPIAKKSLYQMGYRPKYGIWQIFQKQRLEAVNHEYVVFCRPTYDSATNR